MSKPSRSKLVAAILLMSPACSGSEGDELKGADGGNRGRIDSGSQARQDAGGDGSAEEQEGGLSDSDAGGDSGSNSDLAAHPKSCDAPVLAGDPATAASEDLPRLITGPQAKSLVTWAAPQRYWHARSYDGQAFSAITHLFDDRVSGDVFEARAAVGYGHGVFHASLVNSTDSIRRYHEATNTWEAAETMAGQTMLLGVRPTTTLLRVQHEGAVATLENIDANTGVVTPQPLFTAGSFLSSSTPAKLLVDGQDRGAVVIALNTDLRGFVLRNGNVVAEAALTLADSVQELAAVQINSGETVALWAGNAGGSMSRLTYDEQNDTAQWSEPTSIFDGPSGRFVATGTPDGELTAVWLNANTFARRYVNGAWGAVTEVAKGVGTGAYPALAVSESGMVALVVEPSGGGEEIFLHTMLKGEHTWSTIKAGGNSPYRPSVGFDPSGHPFAIWASAANDGAGPFREIALVTCR